MSKIEIKVPTIGESITEVTLSAWLKQNGEYVKIDEPICEFESDKATLEFPAEIEGILTHLAKEGDDLEIGAIIAHIEPRTQTNVTSNQNDDQGQSKKQDGQQPEQAKTPAAKSHPEAKEIEMRVPTIGESITEVTLSAWLVENGAHVNIDDPICEFESDKATLEFPAEGSGLLQHIAKEGEDLEIGALVAKIIVNDQVAPAPKDIQNSPTTQAKQASATGSYASGHPSPSARKILEEKNIDSTQVNGSGKGGRITKLDAIEAVVEPIKPNTIEKKIEPQLPSSSTIFSRDSSRKKMSRMRRTIASRLVDAKNNSAMLTTFNEVDMTEIIKLRKKYQEQFVEKYGIKLGFMSLFAKACANVLMEMPDVNAILDGNELIYHDYVDISIAISTPTGLVVPPVHNVESLRFDQIESKIKDLATKARNGRLSLEEMSGGTFSITNGGIFGSLMSTPILNKPQSAILGMHTIKQRPVAVNGNIEIRPMMYLAMSYDHRVIDGSTSVTFLVKVIQLLEDPMKLMMNI